MVRFLKRVWEDIRQGESIDVYVSVVLAIVLAILSVIDIVPADWIASVTLAVLALLAVAILGNRYKLEGIRNHLSRGMGDVLLREFPADVQSRLEKASEVWLVGGTLNRTSKRYYATIETKLKRGETVRVLIGDPREGTHSRSLQIAQYSCTKSAEEAKKEMGLTLGRLCRLQELAPDNLEIRVSSHYIRQGVFAFDPDKPNGCLYIEYYPFKQPQESLPKLVLHPEDGDWYVFFREQLRAVWDSGEPWQC